MSTWAIKRLSKAIMQGAVVAYPSDTIWGFGCHPLHITAVNRILQVKNRSADKGLILLSSSLEYCLPYIAKHLSDVQLDRLKQDYERPTTWLTPAAEDCPVWLRGRYTTIAIRITQHPLIQSICTQIQAPLVSTSANRQGRPPVRNALQAQRQFSRHMDFIVHGYEAGTQQASRIQSLLTGCTIRTH